MSERELAEGEDQDTLELILAMARAADACPSCCAPRLNLEVGHLEREACPHAGEERGRLGEEEALDALRSVAAGRASAAARACRALYEHLGAWMPPMIAMALRGADNALGDVQRALGHPPQPEVPPIAPGTEVHLPDQAEASP